MRTALVVVAFLVPSACGPESMGIDPLSEMAAFSDEPATAYRLPCIGPIRSDLPTSPRRMAYDLRAAREALDFNGVVPANRFCEAFAGVPVRLYDRIDLGGDRVGAWSVFTGIELERHGFELAHELTHAWEFQNFGIFTFAHPGWNKHGQDDAQMRYRAHMQPMAGRGWVVPLE